MGRRQSGQIIKQFITYTQTHTIAPLVITMGQIPLLPIVLEMGRLDKVLGLMVLLLRL